MAAEWPARKVLKVMAPESCEYGLSSPVEGVYKTVQEAIDAVPLRNAIRTTILIPPGVYRQPIYVPKTKNFITLSGSAPEITVLSWNNTAAKIEHHAPSRVIGTGTFGCGSTIVEGEDFIAENITFENSAPQEQIGGCNITFDYVHGDSSSLSSEIYDECVAPLMEAMFQGYNAMVLAYRQGSGQAVAFRVTADRCAFYNCRFLGWQDTLYLHHGKQYLKDCYIEGSVDFIFGNSTALLEHCHIHCKSQGFITAQSRKSAQEPTGYIFLRCVITGNSNAGYSYLGRPWAPFARVLYAYTWIDSCIKPAGWHNWDKPENERNSCFFEFRCSGPGSCLNGRVPWCRELDHVEAGQLLMHAFIDPDPKKPWLAQRMSARIPHSV